MENRVQRYLVIPSALLFLAMTEVSCADNKGQVRNSYASKDECLRDNRTEDCEEDARKSTLSGGGHNSQVHYWGPWYSSTSRAFSPNASGLVNGAGDFMPSSVAKSNPPSALANFATSGTGSTVKATGTTYSRGGFGSTARASSSSFSGG